MIWLSIIVAVFIGGIFGGIFYCLVAKNKIGRTAANWITIIAITLGFVIMREYGAPYYLAYAFENNIKREDPIFQLLATKSPLEFKQYIEKIQNTFLDREGYKVPYYTGEYVYSQLIKYSPYATNQSFYDLAKATVALYNTIYTKDPTLILTIEFNLQSNRLLDFQQLDKTYNQAFDPVSNAKKMIIESAIQNPQPKLSENEKARAQAIIQNIINTLSANYGNKTVATTFNAPNDPLLNQKIAAEIIIQFYQMLLDRGQDDAGMVFKYLFTNSSLL